ncbi:MAG: Dam family site-specific DNA-(adenine-N6)-methyltransferase [Ruminococcaceae bacterium]|nr:Dam family site-specific DNA-(adenine-N6)-methyltransferase [Oscillospiraceae bacterium]
MSEAFLKWAGGKKWFINRQKQIFPVEYNRYIEPFLGGGSVFFYLKPQNAILSDINEELINTYIAVRDDFEHVYQNLKMHSKKHCENYYYEIRQRKTRCLATSAARMIYLNKTCFNGIYRVNKDGIFNVPCGTQKEICFEYEKLLKSSMVLKKAQILCQDFEQTIDLAQAGDFIFCDPPYTVMDEENRFVGYNADVFSWRDQIRLAAALRCAREKKAKIIMTNIDHPNVRALYENLDGFKLCSIQRKCFISGTLDGRRDYKELIVTANL